MNKLSIEEKAKAYDIALDKIKMLLGTGSSCSREELEYVFPELKETSGEMVRKAILELVRQSSEILEKKNQEQMIAWLEKQGGHAKFRDSIQVGDKVTRNQDGVLVNLSQLNRVAKKDEKQGEQKPADKTEPKFKVEKDKWYVCISQYCNCIEGRNYKASLDGRIIDDYGTEYDMHDNAYRWFRPWTIQDAKDGDVIYSRHNTESFEWIGIFKSLDKENKRVFFYGFWHDMAKTFSVCRNEAYVLYDDFSPATKEQRALLFQKMKKAGYEWDTEKKELKKIEHKSWSEENEKMFNCALDMIEWYSDKNENKSRIVSDWLKSLKDRVQPQQKHEWSEEDEMQLDAAIHLVSNTGHIETTNWLKDLKNRVQLKQEWSNEDERIYRSIIYSFAHNFPLTVQQQVFVKSFKERGAWKPSEEQLSQLYYASNGVHYNRAILLSLLEQLKKL